MTQLSQHFSLDELTFSQTAVRRSIDNTPTDEVLENLRLLAVGLERVRSLLGSPMRISSGYRCPKINAAIGGSRNSAHMQGLAADFTCQGYGTPLEVATAIKEAAQFVGYDQLIYEGAWVHIGFADDPRYQTLTAKFDNGKATYVSGIQA